MKLSDLKPTDYQVEQPAETLKLSGLKPEDISVEPAAPPGVETGFLEALLRGGAQGATFGFADELTGAGEALAQVATTDKTLADLPELYRKSRDESRAEYKLAEQEFPKTSFVGNLAGGVLPGLATGGLGTTMRGAIALGAGSGALAGAGTSEANNLTDLAKETALGGAMGGVLGGTVKVAADKLGPTLENLAKGTASAANRTGQFVSDLEPVQEILAGFRQGAKGRALVGQKAAKSLKDEVGQLYNQDLHNIIDDEVSRTINLQREALRNAPNASVKDWYEGAKRAISTVKDKYGNSEDVLKEVTKLEKEVDNWVLGRMDDLQVNKIEQIPMANAEKLDDIFNKVAELNASAEVKQTLTGEGMKAGKRTFNSEEIQNMFEPDQTVETLTKDGKLMKAQPVSMTEEGEPIRRLAQSADALESAQMNLNEQFILSGLPYEARLMDTKSLGQVVQIVDKTTNKPIGKPFSLDDIAKSGEMGIKESIETVPVRLNGAKGPNMELSPAQINRIKASVGKYGSASETGSFDTTEARTLVNRLLTGVKEGRTLSDVEMDILGALGDDYQPIKELLENNVSGLKGINQKLSSLRSGQESIPTIQNILKSDDSKISGLTPYLKTEEFLNNLPKNVADELSPKIKDISEAVRIRSVVEQPGFGGFVSVRGATYGGANIAGLASKSLYDATPEVIKQVGARAAQIGGKAGAQIQNVLSQAAQKDRLGRNALLFALEQNPEYRGILKEALGEQDQK